MDFTDLDIRSGNNRVRINLSPRAYSILLSDMNDFGIGTGSQERRRVSSTMVNHVFHCFYAQAESSVRQTMANKREELESDILFDMSPAERETAIDLLMKACRKRLETARTVRLKNKGESALYHIDKASVEILQGEAKDEARSEQDKSGYRGVGDYFHALLEEYAEKSYYIREQICFCESLKTIRSGIQGKNALKIKTANQRSGQFLYVKPLEVRQDLPLRYNYLVGMMRSEDRKEWRVGCVRLSRIRSCDQIERFSGAITREDQQRIEKAVAEQGVQYIAGDSAPERVVVQFDEVGEKLYGQLLSQRPMYTQKLGDGSYEFRCTQRQAENYFFKFACNAKIIEPQELADKFYEKHAAAAKQYEKDRSSQSPSAMQR